MKLIDEKKFKSLLSLVNIEETISVLEHLTENSNIKDQEIDVIGELLSNLYGSIEVIKDIEDGENKKNALNKFMKRVQGSIK